MGAPTDAAFETACRGFTGLSLATFGDFCVGELSRGPALEKAVVERVFRRLRNTVRDFGKSVLAFYPAGPFFKDLRKRQRENLVGGKKAGGGNLEAAFKDTVALEERGAKRAKTS